MTCIFNGISLVRVGRGMPGLTQEAVGKVVPETRCLCLHGRAHEPPTEVDLNTLPIEAVMSWHEDMHRFDVSCYLSQHMVTTSEGVLRLPTLRERERLMGFSDNYFSADLYPKLKGADREAVGV